MTKKIQKSKVVKGSSTTKDPLSDIAYSRIRIAYLEKENNTLIRELASLNIDSTKAKLNRLEVFANTVTNILASKSSDGDQLSAIKKLHDNELRWVPK